MVPSRIMLAAIGIGAMFGCSRPAPPPKTGPAPEVRVAPAPLIEVERPRDDFSKRAVPQDDASPPPTEEPAAYFPESKERDD